MDVIRVGEATINLSLLTVEADAGPLPVEPKVMEVLIALVKAQGDVVSRDDLIDQVWGVEFGGDERLSRAVSLLRKALGDDARETRYIETIPKRGYRLIAEVAPVPAGPAPRNLQHSGNEARQFRPGPRVMLVMLVTLLLGIGAVGMTFSALDDRARAADGAYRQDPTGVSFASGSDRNTIAVLPFADLSSAKDQEYFADGLTEEILNAITKFPELRVVGRTSSFRYRGRNTQLADAGQNLNARYLLTGSVRNQDGLLRVAAQLVEASSGQILWSQSFDGTDKRIFEFQENIARAIAVEMGVKVPAKNRLLPELTQSEEAYQVFLQARDLSRRFGKENKRTAIMLFEQAIEIDPKFAAAWAWLANTKILLSIAESGESEKALVAEARSDVSNALAIDPELSMGHYVEAMLHDYDQDFSAAMDAMERAYASDPNQPFMLIRRGVYFSMIGQTKKAETLISEGLRRDPTDAPGLVNLAKVRMMQGNFLEAERLARRSRDLGFAPAEALLCIALAEQGKTKEGISCWENLPAVVRERFDPPFGEPAIWKKIPQADFSQDQPARRLLLARLQNHFSGPEPKANTYLIETYIGLRAPDLFMKRFLAHPFSGNGSAISSVWIDSDQAASVRRHPAFPAFAEKIGLVRAWNKYGWPDRCAKPAMAQRAVFKCT